MKKRKRRVSPLPPSEIRLSATRVLSLGVVEGLVVLTTAEPLVSVVRVVDPLRGSTDQIIRRTRTLRVISRVSIPMAALPELQTALRRVARAK